jgi:hypothetical protein
MKMNAILLFLFTAFSFVSTSHIHISDKLYKNRFNDILKVERVHFSKTMTPYPGNMKGYGLGYSLSFKFNKAVDAGTLFHLVIYDQDNKPIQSMNKEIFLSKEGKQKLKTIASPAVYTDLEEVGIVSKACIDFGITLAETQTRKDLQKGKKYKVELFMNGKKLWANKVVYASNTNEFKR